MLPEKISDNDHTWRKFWEVELVEELMNITKQIEEDEDEDEVIKETESDDEIDSPKVKEIMEEGFSEQLLEQIYQINWKQ